MRPKFLKISGLNSFVEEQTIDFSTLIEGGLFGIFGPTGSGKSTILDAITIALYGHNAIARGTKEFINTDMDKVFLSYDFDCGNNLGRQAYRIERSIKKNNRGGINTDFARLSFLDSDGNPLKIVDKVSEIDDEIKNIIGLSHNDFTRSVVLPQGKFSEFLKLAGSERRNMLERILGLEKYGGNLVDKIRSLKRKKEEELQVLQGELNRFEGITEENIKTLKKELAQVEETERELKKEINLIEKRYEELSRVWELQTELNKYLQAKKKLDTRACAIEEQRRRWERGRNARNVKPYLDRYKDTLEDINRNKNLLRDLIIRLEDVSKKLKETESKYKVVYLIKDRELPALIEKETNIKHAIELKENIDKLIKERDELAVKFTKCSKIIKGSEEELEKLKTRRLENNNRIEELEKRGKELKISPEYRERLTNAWQLKSNSDELKKAEDESLKNIEDLNKRVISNSEDLDKIKGELKEKDKVFNDIKDELEKLEANPPKDNEYILKKEIELHKLKTILEETKENVKKKLELEKELKSIRENRMEAQIKIEYLQKRHKDSSEKLKNVEIEIDELERAHRAGILSRQLNEGSPCPVCGSCEHPTIAEPIPEDTIEKIMKIKEGFLESKRELERAIYEIELEIKREVKEEDKLSKDLELCISKIKDYDVASIEKDIKDGIEEIQSLKLLLKAWEEKGKELRGLLQLKERERVELEKKSIRFVEGINKDKERLEEENKRRDELSNKLKVVYKLYKEAMDELDIEDIEAAMKEVGRKEKELLRLEEELKKLRGNIKDYDIQREKIEEKLNRAMLERGKIEEAGKEKRTVIDEYTEKINKIVGDREPKGFLEEIQEKRIKIVNEEEELRKLQEEEKELLGKLQEKKSGIENTNKTLEKALVNIEKALKDALKENKFNHWEEVDISLVANDELKSMEEEINKYDDEIKRVRVNIARIKEELKGNILDEADFEKFKEDMKSKKESYRTLLEEMGKKKERISEMEKNFERVKEINEKAANLQHITDMLNEMFRLVSGNKFVEYVATSHLRYIAKEASKRLMDITNKRYSLELDSKGNFIICDNYNGGVRRDCNTLSGGETFLTSLALALSLSSQIQLKGNASIEFFFLDEGFGTLDSQLLDTVMTSLERLHQEKLAVGIISHVTELKNRVPIKLVVTPSESGLHGTKVMIERN